jgi:hypothetical protein
MDPETHITRARLTTPRAAAIAGILFSLLLITALVLIRISVPANPQDAGTWLSENGGRVSLALNLVPFGCERILLGAPRIPVVDIVDQRIHPGGELSNGEDSAPSGRLGTTRSKDS